MSTPEDQNYPWYQVADSETSLTQGDLVLSFPVLKWLEAPAVGPEELSMESVQRLVSAARSDLVVMSQACDLENNKINEVLFCAHYAVSEFRRRWHDARVREDKPAASGQWRQFLEGAKNGSVPRFSLLAGYEREGDLKMEVRVVDFGRVFTFPRTVIEGHLKALGGRRLRLCPPYREHLSQGFARFFMRVGLPNAVSS